MLIRALKLSGYRSFPPGKAVDLSSLGQVNLLIGPNNIGKSNLGRFLVRVRDVLTSYRLVTSPWSDGTPWRAPMRIEFAADEIDHWLREEHVIEAEIEVHVEALRSPMPLPGAFVSDEALRVRVTLSRAERQGVLSVVPLTAAGLPIYIEEGETPKLLCVDGTYTESVTATHGHRGLAVAVCHCLATAVLEIRPLRDPGRATNGPREGSTDGGELIAALRACQNGKEQFHWTKCKTDIRKWLQVLLGESEVNFEVNDTGFVVEVQRGGEVFRCSLGDLGAGVSEMLIVLAYLRLMPRKPFLVVVDELEAHLHPGAVVELTRIIMREFPKLQLMITTHSTALMDAVTPSWRAFRVSRANGGGTAVEPIETQLARLGLLADLGIRPSQLFLARVAIWVEGPSDVHYLTALIREAEPALVPGRDFAFVIYGGASGSHLHFGCGAEDDNEDDVEALVGVLAVSHRAAIVCDRDRADEEDIRDVVKILSVAAERRGAHARVVPTAGREIENTVQPEVLKRVLETIRPKRLGTGESLIRLKYDDYAIASGDEFNRTVAKAARRDDGTALSDTQTMQIKDLIDARKCRIAARVRELANTEQVFLPEAVEWARVLARWLLTDPPAT